jgi:hypothetical protein
MDILITITKRIVETVFDGYTPKQTRENIQFLHGLFVFCLVLIFVFSPARSWARWTVIGLFSVFIFLYICFKDCWVSVVEYDYDTEGDYSGPLGPMINLTGTPITKETKDLTTSIAYVYTISLMVVLTLRDFYGIY